ncbi:transmembrane protein 117 [Pungitius pungitius]|uniref:transmembrane protein 117 n=1 Tax=Pungitius pungitius TaxID=134920 RepID=UPI002E124AF4
MEIDARFRYYFQHPWSRLIVAYLVTFFNFLIFAEDPISHSQTEAHMIVVGNCFSFLFNKYPGLGWNVLKVVCWILAIITGMLAGKFIFHRQLFGKSCAHQCRGNVHSKGSAHSGGGESFGLCCGCSPVKSTFPLVFHCFPGPKDNAVSEKYLLGFCVFCLTGTAESNNTCKSLKEVSHVT